MATSRECTKCFETKDLSCFNKDKNGKYGVKPSCIKCTNKQKVEYRKNNKDKIREYALEYNKTPEYKARQQAYKDQNKERLKQVAKLYYDANKDKKREYEKQYKANNRDKVNERMRKYFATNPNARLSHNLRARFHDALKRAMVGKTANTMHFLGADIKTVKNHITQQFVAGMSWENYGEWEIDHILPVASFDLTSIEEQLKCFHYTNLQPLWKDMNRSKGKRILQVHDLGLEPRTSA